MKRLLLLLFVPLINAAEGQITPFAPIDQDQMRELLRPATPTNEQKLLTLQNLSPKQLMRLSALISIVDLHNQQVEKEEQDRKQNNLKETVKIGLIGGIVGGTGNIVLNQGTRGFGTGAIVGAVIGGVGVCGLGWTLFGDYMKTILSFKNDITNISEEYEKMRPQLILLKETNSALEIKIDEAFKLIQPMSQQFHIVRESAHDNTVIASIIQDVIFPRLKRLEEQEGIEPSTNYKQLSIEDMDRASATIKYNKTLPWYKPNKTKFETIPRQWLEENGYGHLLKNS